MSNKIKIRPNRPINKIRLSPEAEKIFRPAQNAQEPKKTLPPQHIDLRDGSFRSQQLIAVTFADSAASQLYLIQNYIRTPDNLLNLVHFRIPAKQTAILPPPLPSHYEVKLTDWGAFIMQLIGTLRVLDLRQNGNTGAFESGHLSDFSRGLFFHSLQYSFDMLAGKPVNNIDKHTILADEKALLTSLECFLGFHRNKEIPEIMCEIIKAWKSFTNGNSPFAKKMMDSGYGKHLSDYPTTPVEWVDACYAPATQEQIDYILSLQADVAKERGNDYTQSREKILKIIKAYTDANMMRPEIMFFRPQAQEVVARKRQEFRSTVKKEFLRYMGGLLKPIDEHSAQLAKTLKDTGSFKQKPFEKGIRSFTVEHSSSLLASDNHHWNLSIVPRIVNHDMNTLIQTQVEAMELRRSSVTEKNGLFCTANPGETFLVVIMRPTVEYLRKPFGVPDSILYAPFRTQAELDQIKRGIIGEEAKPR